MQRTCGEPAAKRIIPKRRASRHASKLAKRLAKASAGGESH
jgi:ribosomal protein S20